MAMISCRECGKEISSEASACPHCGISLKRKGLGFTSLFLVLLVGGLVLAAINEPNPEYKQVQSEPISDADREFISSTQQFLAGKRWDYSTQMDAMSGKPIQFAMLLSSNTVEFARPYDGKQRATLSLRTHPRYGKDVILRIDRGQLLCRHRGCEVSVRFGEREPVSYTALRPEDNSSTLLFIKNYHAFVENMMKSDVVRISPSVYKEGRPIFEFATAGFDPDEYLN